jgi:hypothetical protein
MREVSVRERGLFEKISQKYPMTETKFLHFLRSLQIINILYLDGLCHICATFLPKYSTISYMKSSNAKCKVKNVKCKIKKIKGRQRILSPPRLPIPPLRPFIFQGLTKTHFFACAKFVPTSESFNVRSAISRKRSPSRTVSSYRGCTLQHNQSYFSQAFQSAMSTIHAIQHLTSPSPIPLPFASFLPHISANHAKSPDQSQHHSATPRCAPPDLSRLG